LVDPPERVREVGTCSKGLFGYFLGRNSTTASAMLAVEVDSVARNSTMCGRALLREVL